MCEDAFKRERYQESLEADTDVLVSGVKLASCADSSSGMLTDVIMRAFELIDLSTPVSYTHLCSQAGGIPVYPRFSQPDNSESWDDAGNGI